jgi:hypothetical protein
LTGSCEGAPKVCEDGIGCTIDSCNPATGICEYAPSNVVCDLQDQCNTYTCDPLVGCVSQNLTCPDDGLFCTVAVCVAFAGCNDQALACNVTKKNKEDCGTFECVEEEKQCVKEEHKCASVAIIAAIGLTAGVIAGIVVGVVAFIACAGGASYAAFQQMNSTAANAVVNNPLYKSQGKQGTNPLFKEPGQ